jgi:small subunit ribosomal protein S4
MISHGHIYVNGTKVNIPSYTVSVGDVIEVKESSREIPEVIDSIARSEHRGIPAWVEIDAVNLKGKFLRVPSRDEIQLPAQEQLIVELYSK